LVGNVSIKKLVHNNEKDFKCSGVYNL